MISRQYTFRIIMIVMSAAATVRAAEQKPARPKPAGRPTVTIVTLGDSITKGVRQGVTRDETFAAIVQAELRAKDMAVTVVNEGIGGERTDQALARLDTVLRHRPQFVTVMYGTNDSYVDQGKKDSRLSTGVYGINLRRIVSELLLRGVEPILMTEPRWADDAGPNGVGENPNVRLARYMAVCRDVARDCRVPLVDHFSHWTGAKKSGQKLRRWTTDGCHPNPRGHRELAVTMLPTVLDTLAVSGD